MKLYQAGCSHSVAILGPSLSEKPEELLVEHFDQALLILPGAEAGWEATEDAVRRLALQLWVKAAIMPLASNHNSSASKNFRP
jgi:DNA primase